MDSDTGCVFASFNVQEIINNYNTWNRLTMGKLIISITFINVKFLHIIHIYVNVCKQMTEVKLLLFHSYSRNNLNVGKQMRKSK